MIALFFVAMPLSTTTGGSGLSRSEAAILAWKKRARAAKPGALDPKIAARVKEILAGKQKKGKAPKGKGKAKAAPKGTPQEIANQNRAAVAKQGGMDKLEGVMVRLGAGMNSDLEKGAHDELIKKGLAKRGADGKPKLTPAGRKWRSAADKGDADGASAALAEGRGAASESAAKDKEKSAKQAERAAKGAERAAKQKKQQQAQKQKAQAAAKVKAEKAKAKAATPAKEKPADAAKKQADNRAKVAKDMAEQDAGLAPTGSAALGDFADGKPLKEETAKEFEAMGLVEKGSDGTHRLTSEGRAAAAAMNKGDTRAAIDAISRAGDKKKPKATGKALDMSDELFSINDLLAIKAGARHSRTDVQHLQSIHDSAVACGASCGPGEDAAPDDEDEEGMKAIKGIMDNPAWYAQHECGDVMQAASALQTLTMLIQSELSEEDKDASDVAQLCDAARVLVKFIASELDELEGAAGDAADNVRMGPMNKAVTDDYLHIDGGAIKSLDGDAIKGCAVLFGTAETHDIERDYYDKNTDYWLNHFGWPKPITYHHGMDAATRDNPVVGHWTKATVDDTGVWLEGQLDRAHAYYKAIKELAARGYLKLSSDSAPQWVQRVRQTNGASYIKRWPIVTSSVTVSPMEPRMMPVEVKAFLAELGYEAIETDNQEAIDPDLARRDGVKASDDERARVLSLELDLLELETA
jgi:hypothetical protein